jgi:hypothetical protein
MGHPSFVGVPGTWRLTSVRSMPTKASPDPYMLTSPELEPARSVDSERRQHEVAGVIALDAAPQSLRKRMHFVREKRDKPPAGAFIWEKN